MADEKIIEQQMEHTRRAMDETRASLAAKIDSLECKMADTVQGATEAVATVKETVQDATDMVSSVKETVGNTVDSMKETVEETVQSVRDKVQDTVTAVSDSFDIKAHVERHPWAMVGGAAALGFLAGHLMHVDEAPSTSQEHAPANGNGHSHHPARAMGQRSKKQEVRTESSWLDSLVQRFEPELDKFKNMALGMLVNVVHEWMAPTVPETFRPQFAEVMHDLSQKMTCPESIQEPTSSKKPAFSPEAHRFAS